MIKLERGKAYPMAIPLMNTAVAELLRDSGNVLLIALNPMNAADEWVLRNGQLKIGMLHDETAILLFFRFFGKNGYADFTFDCPFDARIMPREKLNLPNMETSMSRLAMEIHAIDKNKILRALRMISWHLSLSTDFLSATMDQLANPQKISKANKQIEKWLAMDIDNLYSLVTFQECGK